MKKETAMILTFILGGIAAMFGLVHPRSLISISFYKFGGIDDELISPYQ